MSSVFEQPVTLHRPRQTVPASSQARWGVDAIEALFDLPFPELMHQAQTVHRENFDPSRVEFATLLSVKTGGCAENCGYCSQSAHFKTGLKAEKLMDADDVVAELGQTGAGHRADVPQTEDRYLHRTSLGPQACAHGQSEG